MRRELVTGVETALQQKLHDRNIITEADILTVSDGRSLVAAHAGGTHNLITGHVKTFAALLQVVR